MATKMINFRLPEDEASQLDSVASERGLTISELLRKLVDDLLYPKNESQPGTLNDEGEEIDLADVYDMVMGLKENFKENSSDIQKVDEHLGELDTRQDTDTKSVVRLANDRADSLEKRLSALNDRLNKYIETFNAWLAKFHVCPDCGHSLHLHKVGDFVMPIGAEKTSNVIQGETWHLECLHCGFCTTNYQYPKWKEQMNLFNPKPAKETSVEEKKA